MAGPSEKRPKGAFCVYCAGGCHKSSYRNTAGKLPKVEFYRFPWRKYDDNRKARGSLPYNDQGQRGICGSPCGRGEQKEPRCNAPGLSANDISVERHTSGDSDGRHRPVLHRWLCTGLHSVPVSDTWWLGIDPGTALLKLCHFATISIKLRQAS